MRKSKIYYIIKKYIFSSLIICIFCAIGLILMLTRNYIKTKVLMNLSKLPNPQTDMDEVRKELIYIFFSEMFCAVLLSLQSYSFMYMSKYIKQKAEKDTLKFYISLKYHEYKKTDIGNKSKNLELYSNACTTAIDYIIQKIPMTLSKVIFAVVSLTSKGNITLNVILFLNVVFNSSLALIFGFKIGKLSSKIYKMENQQSSNIINVLENYESILFKHLNDYEYTNINILYRKILKQRIKMVNWYTYLYFIQDVISKTYLILSLLFGIYNKPSWESIITVTTFIVIYREIDQSITQFPALIVLLKSRLVIIEATLNYREEVSMVTKKDNIIKNTFNDKISFSDVLIKFNKNTILSNINITIKKGEKIAIIGENGCGKSSILKILLRFFEYSGNILIDGINTQNIEYEEYLKLFSYISQDLNLFNNTVMYNMKYGSFGVKDDDIIKICKILNIHESILKLENNYHTIVGEVGDKMSGGTKQKILLVRTLIKNTHIYLLDEPTSSLDKFTEKNIIEYIFNELKDKTILMIIHDKRYLNRFDRIFRIKDNNIYVHENINGNIERETEEFW